MSGVGKKRRGFVRRGLCPYTISGHIHPVSCAFNKHQSISSHAPNGNGHIDTIRALIYNENFV